VAVASGVILTRLLDEATDEVVPGLATVFVYNRHSQPAWIESLSMQGASFRREGSRGFTEPMPAAEVRPNYATASAALPPGVHTARIRIRQADEATAKETGIVLHILPNIACSVSVEALADRVWSTGCVQLGPLYHGIPML